jgi:hypothetical protein
MTNQNGHTASVIIAFVFAALLAAAWIPSSHERATDVRHTEGRDLERIIREEVARKSEMPPHSETHVAAVEPHTAHGTALPSSPHLSPPPVNASVEEKAVEPDRRKVENVEGNTTLMNGLQVFYCFADIVLMGLAGLIWWNTWSTRKTMDQLRIEAAEQTLEAQQFSRAAASLENLVKTATAPMPSASSPATPPSSVKPPRKKRQPKQQPPAVAS